MTRFDATIDTCVQDQFAGNLLSYSDAVSSVLAYPMIAETFKMSHSTFPSSATVKQQFRAAAQIFMP